MMKLLLAGTAAVGLGWIWNWLTYPPGEYAIADRSRVVIILAVTTVVDAIAWLVALFA